MYIACGKEKQSTSPLRDEGRISVCILFQVEVFTGFGALGWLCIALGVRATRWETSSRSEAHFSLQDGETHSVKGCACLFCFWRGRGADHLDGDS